MKNTKDEFLKIKRWLAHKKTFFYYSILLYASINEPDPNFIFKKSMIS